MHIDKKTIKKYLNALFILGCVCAALSGCGGNNAEAEDSAGALTQSDADSLHTDTSDTPGGIILSEPEVIYEDADITIPAGIAGNEVSDEQIINIDEDNASITYSLSRNERSDIIRQLSGEITESIDVILADKDHYPNITAITPNDDYTEFTIALTGGNINTYESMLVMSFYIVGNKYQIYNGVSAENAATVVRYVDSVTGSVISETDSSLMENVE